MRSVSNSNKPSDDRVALLVLPLFLAREQHSSIPKQRCPSAAPDNPNASRLREEGIGYALEGCGNPLER